MYKIKWIKSFYTKISIIDEQHLNFIHLLNNLFSSDDEHDLSKYSEKIKIIYNDIITHFATEENLMRESKFRGFFSHKAEHDRFARSFMKKFIELEANHFKGADDLLKSVEKWFVNHLELNDRKFTDYLISINNADVTQRQ